MIYTSYVNFGYNDASSCGGDGPDIDSVGKLGRRDGVVTITVIGNEVIADGASVCIGDEAISLLWHSTSNSIVSGMPVPLSSVSHSRFSENLRCAH